MTEKNTLESIGGIKAARALYEKWLEGSDEPMTKTGMWIPMRVRASNGIARTELRYLGASGHWMGDDLDFRRFGGVCHASSNVNRDRQICLFSYPLSDHLMNGQRTERMYSKGFLDGFYSWLTTESAVKGAFLEPWNGKYLCLNTTKPMNLVLAACILSRYPQEFGRNTGFPFSFEEVRGLGFDWPETIMILSGAYPVDVEGHRKLVYFSNNLGSHGALDINSMTEKEIIDWLSGRVEDKRLNGSWNNLKQPWGGVFYLLCNSQRNYGTTERSDIVNKLAKSILNANMLKESITSWGSVNISRASDYDQSKRKDQKEVILSCYREWFDSIKAEVKAK